MEKIKEMLISQKDEDTIGILLVGSWARGEGTDRHDIDIIKVKHNQLVGIQNEEYKGDDYTLDIWVHDIDNMKSELSGDVHDANQLTNTSLIISFLNDAEIWFEEGTTISELKEQVAKWNWSEGVENVLNFTPEEPEGEWLKNAYNESLELLNQAKQRIQANQPASHRRKDYPELLKNIDEKNAKVAYEKTMKAYEKLGIERNWTEFRDTRVALEQGEYGKAVASIKDILRFMVRYELPSAPDQLLDPALWKSVEVMKISDELVDALKFTYSL
jgi:predicted nucleotidyltransferase